MFNISVHVMTDHSIISVNSQKSIWPATDKHQVKAAVMTTGSISTLSDSVAKQSKEYHRRSGLLAVVLVSLDQLCTLFPSS